MYETDCPRTYEEESAGKMYVECDIFSVYFLSVCFTTTLGVIVHEDG